MKTKKTIDEKIERLEFKLKWYQTSVNLLNAEIAFLKLQKEKSKPVKEKRTHHGFNRFGEKY